MTMWWPIVRARKRFRSSGICQGRRLSLRIAPLRAQPPLRAWRGRAAVGSPVTVVSVAASDGHRRPDQGVRLVALQREVLVAEGEQIGDGGVEPHARQRPRLASELLARLIEVVQIQVRITQGVDK